MSNIYVTSDMHFSHRFLVDRKHRKFKNIANMNGYLMGKWNKYVLESSTVYHLGDFSFKSNLEDIEELHSYLNGKIIHVKGNHDKKSLTKTKNIVIEYMGEKIELVHDPRDAIFASDIILHGHIHASGNRTMPFEGYYLDDHIFLTVDGVLFYNVNCEFHNYSPLSLNAIIKEIHKVFK